MKEGNEFFYTKNKDFFFCMKVRKFFYGIDKSFFFYMPKSKELTEFERGEIVGLSKINLSVRKIAEVLLIAKSTVQDVINKYRRRGLITAAPRSGRPPILTPRNTRTLIKMVKKDR